MMLSSWDILGQETNSTWTNCFGFVNTLTVPLPTGNTGSHRSRQLWWRWLPLFIYLFVYLLAGFRARSGRSFNTCIWWKVQINSLIRNITLTPSVFLSSVFLDWFWNVFCWLYILSDVLASLWKLIYAATELSTVPRHVVLCWKSHEHCFLSKSKLASNSLCLCPWDFHCVCIHSEWFYGLLCFMLCFFFIAAFCLFSLACCFSAGSHEVSSPASSAAFSVSEKVFFSPSVKLNNL